MRIAFSGLAFSAAAFGVVAIGGVACPANAGDLAGLKQIQGESTGGDSTRVAQQNAPPAGPASAPPAKPDPLLGDWRMTYLSGGDPVVLKIDKVTRGIIGAALSGSLTTQGGKACPLSGAIFDALAGMYPDGAKIVTMDIRGMMRIAANCDGASTTIEAFVVNSQGKFFGAGRATLSPPAPAPATISTVQLSH